MLNRYGDGAFPWIPKIKPYFSTFPSALLCSASTTSTNSRNLSHYASFSAVTPCNFLQLCAALYIFADLGKCRVTVAIDYVFWPILATIWHMIQISISTQEALMLNCSWTEQNNPHLHTQAMHCSILTSNQLSLLIITYIMWQKNRCDMPIENILKGRQVFLRFTSIRQWFSRWLLRCCIPLAPPNT